MFSIQYRLCLAVCLTFTTVSFAEDKLSVAPNHESGIYNIGESVTWTIQCESAEIFAGVDVTYQVLEGVLAAYNALQGEKQIVIMPLADHSGDHRSYNDKFGSFLASQKNGALAAGTR